MGVRIDHSHGTKDCFVTTTPANRYGSRFEKQAVVNMPNGSRFAVAYLPWTGHWYAFDVDTGKEIATFTSEFYEPNIAPLAIALVPDPDCLVSR